MEAIDALKKCVFALGRIRGISQAVCMSEYTGPRLLSEISDITRQCLDKIGAEMLGYIGFMSEEEVNRAWEEFLVNLPKT